MGGESVSAETLQQSVSALLGREKEGRGPCALPVRPVGVLARLKPLRKRSLEERQWGKEMGMGQQEGISAEAGEKNGGGGK